MTDLNHWMNFVMPETVKKLEQSILHDYHIETGEHFSLSGCTEIVEILDDLLSVMFPACYGSEELSIEEITFYLHDKLRHINRRFIKHLKAVCRYRCRNNSHVDCNGNCDEKAYRTLINLIEALPEIRGVLLADIRAAAEGDPAAYSLDEIVLSYPFVDTVATYRIAHNLYMQDIPIIPRIMSERSHSRTGIDIHPGAVIGPGFFIDHGTGVVIGETCTIGKNVKLYQGVTLGALSPFDKEGRPKKGQKRHPDIEDDVIIYANATILGGKTVIGKGSIIGGNSWITKSVPPGTVVNRS